MRILFLKFISIGNVKEVLKSVLKIVLKFCGLELIKICIENVLLIIMSFVF